MVAKSYQALEQIGEPYAVGDKMYVLVKAKSGNKQVRWYSVAEYNKMYPGEKVEDTSKKSSKYWRSQKDVLGFENGYITIFKGDTYPHADYFRLKRPLFNYTRWFGWSLPSTAELPDDIPDGLTPVRLDWALVGKDEENVKDEKEIAAAIESLIYDEGTSEWQGIVGERIDRTLTVTKAVQVENNFGINIFHVFVDVDGNEYAWSTNAKNLAEGKTYQIRGTIKDLTTYKGNKQTILTRCKVVE